MRKTVFIIIFTLLSFQSVLAQFRATLDAITPKQDTMLFYMKNSGGYINNKDSADYFLFIMPQDTATHFYPIYEYYPNGKTKLVGLSNSTQYNRLSFEGTCTKYFSNGRRESNITYKAGKQCGGFVNYFPNGKIYNMGNVTEKGQYQLIECRDSTGNVLTENGNGKWIILNGDFKTIRIQGTVKDSLKEGEWDGMEGDRVACVNIYKHGSLVLGTYYFKNGKKYQYHTDDVEPHYADGGAVGFNQYLAKAVKFPAVDRENGTQGKVIVTFVVERDGTLTDVKALRGPTQTMMDAGVQAVQQSPPWTPGIQNGIPVRVQYTISFAFSFAK